MPTTIRYLLLTLFRDRLFHALLLGLVVIFSASLFLGGTALVEGAELSLVLCAGISRLYLMVGLILCVCFHVRRAFENREVDFFLSKPMTRAGFVFCYWLGFVAIALGFVVLLVALLAALFNMNTQGLLLFGGSVFLEALIVSAFALAASLIMQSAVNAALAGFGFYATGRLMGYMLSFLDKPGALQASVHDWADFALAATAMLLPRLDLFAKTDWLLYGLKTGDLWPFIVQAVVYVPLLLAMGMYDFARRQF